MPQTKMIGYAREPEIGPIQMAAGLAALGWLGYAWDAYMQIGPYGAVLAAITGFSVVYFARVCAPDKELSLLYGWDDDVITHSLVRMPIVASIFFGPAFRHLSLELFPDYFDGRRIYAPVLVGSVIAGVIMAFRVSRHRQSASES